MATNPIGGSLSPVTLPNLLSTFDRNTLASAIEVLVAVVDAMDGDADQEDGTDLEDDFRLTDLAMGFDRGRGPGCDVSDTGEDDGEDRGLDEGEPDMRSYRGEGAGCRISDDDSAVDDKGCDDNWDDREEEQMPQDVPMLATYSLDYNLFTDQRDFLGINNLTTSFRTNGGEVMSAETRAVLVTRATGDLKFVGASV